jgi:hypothetical protein
MKTDMTLQKNEEKTFSEIEKKLQHTLQIMKKDNFPIVKKTDRFP